MYNNFTNNKITTKMHILNQYCSMLTLVFNHGGVYKADTGMGFLATGKPSAWFQLPNPKFLTLTLKLTLSLKLTLTLIYRTLWKKN